jgi:hypothetical protein
MSRQKRSELPQDDLGGVKTRAERPQSSCKPLQRDCNGIAEDRAIEITLPGVAPGWWNEGELFETLRQMLGMCSHELREKCVMGELKNEAITEIFEALEIAKLDWEGRISETWQMPRPGALSKKRLLVDAARYAVLNCIWNNRKVFECLMTETKDIELAYVVAEALVITERWLDEDGCETYDKGENRYEQLARNRCAELYQHYAAIVYHAEAKRQTRLKASRELKGGQP